MSNSDHRSDKLRNARDVFTGWLRERGLAGAHDLENLCALHPELTSELQSLYSAFQLGHAAASSRALHETLREQFGDVEEVTVQLEEAVSPAVPVSSVPSIGVAAAGSSNRTARYALEEEVARGGMGVIFRVRDRDLSRTLAMKVMTLTPGATPSATDATTRLGLARFLEEAQVTAQLDHPGIVPVHEVGLDDQGRPFFTMKLVKGRDLDEIFELARAEKEDWNLPRALGAVVKACQALAYAHAKGVIHRDLKPANIMVGRFGEVFVMDWGLAKISGKKDLHDIRPKDAQLTSASLRSPRRESTSESTPDSPLITMDGSVVGTPAYMPLEQARGQVEEVDRLSDVYSLGAILYNLLTGHAPYVEPDACLSPHTILARVLDGPPKRIAALTRKVPAELVAICEKAMAREKRNRYASSLDLAEDLQAFLDHRVVRAYRTGAVAEFKSWVTRNKALASVAGVAALLPAIGVGLFIHQEDLAREALRRNAYAADMRVAALSLEQQNLGHADDLLRRYLPKRGEEDLRGFEWRYLWQQCRGDELYTLNNESIVNSAIYSPDGRQAATASFDGTVRIWDLGTHSQVKALSGFSELIAHGYISFSPDGKWFAAARGTSVVIWNASTWSEFKTFAMPAARLVFSPDGRWLAGLADKELRIWDTASWQSRRLPTATTAILWGMCAFSLDSNYLVAVDDVNVEVWSVPSGQKRRDLEFTGPANTCVAVSKNDIVAVGKWGGAIRLWNLETAAEIATTNAHPQTVWSLAFSPNGRTLATASFDQTVKLWDVASLRTTATLRGHRDEVWSVAFSPNGSSLLTGSKDRTARLWSTQARADFPEIPAGDGTAHFSSDSRFLITVASTKTNLVMDYWDVKTAQHARTQRLAEETAFRLILPRLAAAPLPSSDGRKLACALTDSPLQIMDLEKMTLTPTTLTGHFGGTNSPDGFSFSSESRLLLARTGGQQRLWDVAANRERALPKDYWLYTIANVNNALPVLSPDGRILAGPSTNFSVKLWDYETQRELAVIKGHAWFLNSPRFSPDGKLLATFGGESFARLWRVPSGVPAAPPLRGHKEGDFDSDFSADGRTLATSTTENTTRLWHVATGQELMSIENTSIPIFAPDGNTLAVRTTSGQIRLIRAPTLAEIDAAEAKPTKVP
jgi:WD40 repeat protein/serine/threonine protein kinase